MKLIPQTRAEWLIELESCPLPEALSLKAAALWIESSYPDRLQIYRDVIRNKVKELNVTLYRKVIAS